MAGLMLKKQKEGNNEDEKQNNFSELEIVNFLGQYLKNYIYSLIYASIASMYIHNSDELNICSSEGRYFVVLVQIAAASMGFLNLGSFARYKQLRSQDFIVLYIINIFFFLFVMGYVFYSIAFHQKECNTLIVLQKALLYICFKKEFEIAILLFTRSQWWIRQINICTNSVFTVIVLTSANQQTCSPEACLNNNLVNTINIATLITYTLMNILVLKKNKQVQVSALKITSILVICTFIYSYLRVLYFQFRAELPFSSYCVPILYAMDAYVYVIPVDLTGMILLHFSIIKEFSKKDSLYQPESDSLLNLSYQNKQGIQQVKSLQTYDYDEEKHHELQTKNNLKY